MTWQDKPDGAGDWAVRYTILSDPLDIPAGRVLRLDGQLQDEFGQSWSTYIEGRWCKLPPDTPPLKPGLLRWNLLGNRGDGVLWPNGEITLLRESFQVLFCGENSCRTAGYELTQD